LRSYGAADRFSHLCGSQEYFRQMQGLTAEEIARRVHAALKERVRC